MEILRVATPSTSYGGWCTGFAALAVVATACVFDACVGAAPPAAPTPTPAGSSPTVISVAVTGSAPAVGATAQFTATATLSDGTTQSVTARATWGSSNTSIASVNENGLVTGVGAGDADITALYQTISGESHIAVARPAAITFTISGVLTDATSGGILPNIKIQAVDSASATQSTTTDGTGAYSIGGVASGVVTMTAAATSYQTITRTVSLAANTRVDIVLARVVPTVTAIAVTGSAPAVGATAPFTATATMSDGATQSVTVVTAQATWSSSNISIASVNTTGLVTGVGPGEADITAAYQSVSGRSHIAVARPPAPPPSPAPPSPAPSPPAPSPLNLSGTWTGTGSDSQGAETLRWVLTQVGNALSGSASTRPANPSDGSCASCHKVKDGSLSATLSGTTLTLRMLFPTGGSVPTPICSVIMESTASGVTSNSIAASYSGSDSCEGAFAGGTFSMTRQP